MDGFIYCEDEKTVLIQIKMIKQLSKKKLNLNKFYSGKPN